MWSRTRRVEITRLVPPQLLLVIAGTPCWYYCQIGHRLRIEVSAQSGKRAAMIET
jgi:hypothetical protein